MRYNRIITTLLTATFMTSTLALAAPPKAIEDSVKSKVESAPVKKATVAFLGVFASRVGASLRTHLTLQPEVGLTVDFVAPNSPAAARRRLQEREQRGALLREGPCG